MNGCSKEQLFCLLKTSVFQYKYNSSFIREWWESGDDVTLITRPRRFGKTLNMSMVEQFFSVDYAAARAKICEIIRNLYIKYSFVRECSVLGDADRTYFDRILDVNVQDSDITSALYQLSDYLKRYYGKK